MTSRRYPVIPAERSWLMKSTASISESEESWSITSAVLGSALALINTVGIYSGLLVGACNSMAVNGFLLTKRRIFQEYTKTTVWNFPQWNTKIFISALLHSPSVNGRKQEGKILRKHPTPKKGGISTSDGRRRRESIQDWMTFILIMYLLPFWKVNGDTLTTLNLSWTEHMHLIVTD